MRKTIQKLLQLNATLAKGFIIAEIMLVSVVGTVWVLSKAPILNQIPLFSERQNQELLEIVRTYSIPFNLATVWALGTAITQIEREVRKQQQEAAHNAALVEQAQRDIGAMFRRGEIEIVRREANKPRVTISFQCRNCRYLSRDLTATVCLAYPCAVRPSGPDSENCSDWKAMEVSPDE